MLFRIYRPLLIPYLFFFQGARAYPIQSDLAGSHCIPYITLVTFPCRFLSSIGTFWKCDTQELKRYTGRFSLILASGQCFNIELKKKSSRRHKKVIEEQAVRLGARAAVGGTQSFIKLMLRLHIFGELPFFWPYLEQRQICFLLPQYLLLHCWHTLKELT